MACPNTIALSDAREHQNARKRAARDNQAPPCQHVRENKGRGCANLTTRKQKGEQDTCRSVQPQTWERPAQANTKSSAGLGDNAPANNCTKDLRQPLHVHYVRPAPACRKVENPYRVRAPNAKRSVGGWVGVSPGVARVTFWGCRAVLRFVACVTCACAGLARCAACAVCARACVGPRVCPPVRVPARARGCASAWACGRVGVSGWARVSAGVSGQWQA